MLIGIDASRAFVSEKTGTENYSYHLIREMLRLPMARKHQFVLFTRPGSLIPDWVRVSQADLPAGKAGVVAIPYRYLWTQVGLAAAIRRYPLDLLFIPAHTLPVFRPPRLKTVVTIHGLEYQWLPEYRNWLQRWYLPLSTFYAARAADRLIAVSEFTKRQLVELGTEPGKIEVIYEGARLSSRAAGPAGLNVLAKYHLQNTKYVLFVGTVQPRKNLVSLIEAFSLIVADFPDVKLVIAGAKGWMTEEIYRAPGVYGVQERVVFAGRVGEPELSVLYSGARLYVQPSLQEGFGLPVLEAMRWGVPVVTSDGGALPDVVGQAGVVVELEDQFVSRLAKEMETLLSDAPKRRELIAAGRKRASALTWAKAAEKTLKTLVEIV